MDKGIILAVTTDVQNCTFEIINDQAVLQEKITHWNTLTHIIIDTEFMRVDTFYPIPGLIQIADDVGVYLIDPLAIPDLKVFKPLLSGSTVKVMHSMSEDIALFQRVTDCTPQKVFDTQIACALLGHGLSIGYQKLIELYLGFTIDKGETRSDWLKRPLSDSQLSYAAKDVHYLSAIFPILQQALVDKGLDGIVLNESAMINQAMEVTSSDVDNYYLKFRAAWKFDSQKQRALKALSGWREKEARKKDKPRSRIVSDKQILSIVERDPKSASALRSSGIINPVQFRKYGEVVMSLLSGSSSDNQKITPISRPLSGQMLAMYRLLKKTAEKIANANDIAPDLLGKKRLLEDYVVSSFGVLRTGSFVSLPASMGAWRVELLNEPFKKVLEGNSNDQ